MKKPIKDTKLGGWLRVNVPKALDIVGDALPDKGVLGIIKNLIDKEPNISPAQKQELLKGLQQHERELMALEVEDRKSSRTREVDFIKASGHIDYLMWFLAISAIFIFGYLVDGVMNEDVPEKNRELVYHIFGIIEGVIISIFSYYFGSSAGSRIKDMRG